MKCFLHIPNAAYPDSNEYVVMSICRLVVLEHCPEVFYFPNGPVLFGQLYTASHREDVREHGGFWQQLRYADKDRFAQYDLHPCQSYRSSRVGSQLGLAVP